MIKETDLAYAAGVIDSDGCITISHEKRTNRPHIYHRLNVRVVTTDTRILEWFKTTFGGYIYIQNKPKGARKACWAWQKRDTPAGEFLKSILPYLIYKKDQALVALDFRLYKETNKHQKFDESSVTNESAFSDTLKNLHQYRKSFTSIRFLESARIIK